VLLERLISTYATTATKLMADAERAMEQGDAMALRNAVHTLKSSSANLGATTLSRRFAALETYAREGSMPPAEQEWAAACDEYERALQALQSLMAVESLPS